MTYLFSLKESRDAPAGDLDTKVCEESRHQDLAYLGEIAWIHDFRLCVCLEVNERECSYVLYGLSRKRNALPFYLRFLASQDFSLKGDTHFAIARCRAQKKMRTELTNNTGLAGMKSAPKPRS